MKRQRGAGAGENVAERPSARNMTRLGSDGVFLDPKLGPGRFSVTLPYPPSVNHLWRRVGDRTLLSAEGRRYHELVAFYVSGQAGDVPAPPHALTILAVLPDRRKRDIDNILKALLDPLYRAIGLDDSVVARLSIEKVAPDDSGARVHVTIEPLEHAAQEPSGGGS